jgi:chromosome partitioning protein
MRYDVGTREINLGLVEAAVTSDAAADVRASPHVIVVGNEKGGTGKTTIAMHLAIGLLKNGHRVATIDLDSRQTSLTHYIENRRNWARRNQLAIELPRHFSIARAEGYRIDENELTEFTEFDRAVRSVQSEQDFVIIDTPPHDTYLMRLGHSIADTLVTPLNDSFLDLDVLTQVDPIDFSVRGISHYGDMVREARRNRRRIDGALIDWVVVPNRSSGFGSPSKGQTRKALAELSYMLAFRVIDGLAERLVYRENFCRGLTGLDEVPQTLPVVGSVHVNQARHEVQSLLDLLRLPVTDRGRSRAAARAEWSKSCDESLQLDDILVL